MLTGNIWLDHKEIEGLKEYILNAAKKQGYPIDIDNPDVYDDDLLERLADKLYLTGRLRLMKIDPDGIKMHFLEFTYGI